MCDVPDGPLAEAGASGDGLVPEEGDGLAGEDGAEDCPAGPGEDEGHEAEVEDSEGAVWEDAEVLQQDGELGHEEAQVVEDDACPEGFG